jgi:hypothetical protein
LQIGPFTFRFTDPTAARGRPAPVPPAVALLEAEGLSEPLRLEDRLVLIGRRETADISLTENSASSAHAVLIATSGGHVVRDLNSRTGTFVNDAKIHEHVLEPGDMVRVGETTMRYGRARNQSVALPVAPAAPAARVAPAAPVAAPAAPAAAPEAVAKPEADASEAEKGAEPEAEPETGPKRSSDQSLAPAPADTAPAGDARIEGTGSREQESAAPSPAATLDTAPGDLSADGNAPGAALADKPDDGEEGSSLGVGAYLNSMSATRHVESKAGEAEQDQLESPPAVEAGPGGSPAGDSGPADAPAATHDNGDEVIPLASSDELFDGAPTIPEPAVASPDGATPTPPDDDVGSAEVASPMAEQSPAVPSPALPSPAFPSPALAAGASGETGSADVPELENADDGGDEIPELMEPAAVAGPEGALASPSPSPAPPLPPAPQVYPAAPSAAALPVRPAWGNRARSLAPPGSSAAPRQGGASGAGWGTHPAPPAPPPSALPSRRAAGLKPPGARKTGKPSAAPAPRADRPRSPFDRTRAAESEPEPVDGRLPEESDVEGAPPGSD